MPHSPQLFLRFQSHKNKKIHNRYFVALEYFKATILMIFSVMKRYTFVMTFQLMFFIAVRKRILQCFQFSNYSLNFITVASLLPYFH